MDKTEIESLKAANPILDILGELGIPVQNNRIRCLKPENHTHGDRTPSVSIWPDRGQFKCWVCPDIKGDIIDLVRLVRGCGFRDALDFLNHRPGLHLASHFPSPPITHFPAASREEPTELAETRRLILKALLDACPPIGGKVAQYLQKRRIFKRTWDRQNLKMVEDYAAVSRKLESAFGLADLERTGIFNPAGHLRFYRHKLFFPYFDGQGKPVYMQARAIEPDVKPKELSLSGQIPLPYNCRILDREPGQIYLCEGVIDTLTLIEQGFPAVGVPGAANFKAQWAELFLNKTVHVAFDPDAPGESGAAKAINILQAHGIEARRFTPPKGMDLNDWFLKG
jgi:DNA primase